LLPSFVLLAIATRRLPVPTGGLGASAGADMLATLRAPGPRLLALSFALSTRSANASHGGTVFFPQSFSEQEVPHHWFFCSI